MTRSQGENRFYVHEVYATNEKGTSPFKTGTTASSRTPGEDVPSVISILNSIREVKKKIEKCRGVFPCASLAGIVCIYQRGETVSCDGFFRNL